MPRKNDPLASYELSKYMTEIARRGGKARAKKLTASERKANAIKASKAAAKARTERARKRGIS